VTNPPWQDRTPDDADIDAAFAAIVAGWDRDAEPVLGTRSPGTPAPTEVRRAPDGPPAEPGQRPGDVPGHQAGEQPGDQAGERPGDGRSDPGPAPPPPPARVTPFEVAPTGWRVHIPQADEDLDEEGFQAPDPPLPRGNPLFWVAFAGLVLGPLGFVGWALTGPHSTNLPYLLAAIATLAGFVALIKGLPERHDEDDDGARV